MNFLKKKWVGLVLFSFVLIVPFISLAGDGDGNPSNVCPKGTICNPLAGKGVDTIPDLIQKILEGALKIGIPLVALAVIYSGFLFVKARGNPEEITHAKEALMYTLIGAAILLGSWAIASMISATITSLGS